MRVVAFATKGSSTNEEDRLRDLLSGVEVEFTAFDKAAKLRSFRSLIAFLVRRRPDLIVMEGTGIAGGLSCLFARLCLGSRYVFSSGDAVGPFMSSRSRLLAVPFGLYERLLCRLAAGFIGWTPYLCGRAMTFGTPRAVTAAGWAPYVIDEADHDAARSAIREKLGIPADAIVFGLVGSLVWNPRRQYCYGQELVQAVLRSTRSNATVLVVGDGDGYQRLRDLAGPQINRRIFLPGMAASVDVPRYLAAMDVASLPQSVDGVGNFRYTTKLSEYLAARLPVVTGQIPLSYDLNSGWIWRLAGTSPWDDRFINALASLMDTVSPDEIETHRRAVPVDLPLFRRAQQRNVVSAFIRELMDDLAVRR